MFHSFPTSAVLSAMSQWASGGVYAAETEGSFLAQPPLWGAIAVVASVLAYTGVWRGWSRTPIKALGSVPFPFGIGFFGVGILIAAIPVPYPANRIVVYFALALMMFSVVGVLWLPRFLLPRWFKEEKGLIPKKTERLEHSHRAGGSLQDPSLPDSLAQEPGLAGAGSNAVSDDLLKLVQPGTPGGATAIGGYLGGAINGSAISTEGSDAAGDSSGLLTKAFGSDVDDNRSLSD